MSGLVVQLMVPVALAHGFRWLGVRLGPRRGAILMGLPTTTGVALYSFGVERGVGEASGAAEAGLFGLVAAALMPVVYARSLRSGWGLPGVPIASVLGYCAVAITLGGIAGGGPLPAVVVATLGVGLAVALGSTSAEPPGSGRRAVDRAGRPPSRGWRPLLARTAIPALMALGVRFTREAGGPWAAGLFLTFPATSLALLVSTQVESGPAAACRLACALPLGALGLSAFLATFSHFAPLLGPLEATLLGYAASLLTLWLADTCGRLPVARSRALRSRLRARASALSAMVRRARFAHGPHRVPGGVGRLRRHPFSPLLEALPG